MIIKYRADHRRLLLRFQTSKQWENERGSNQGLPLEIFSTVLESEQQESCPYCAKVNVLIAPKSSSLLRQSQCPYCAKILVSETGLQGDPPAH